MPGNRHDFFPVAWKKDRPFSIPGSSALFASRSRNLRASPVGLRYQTVSLSLSLKNCCPQINFKMHGNVVPIPYFEVAPKWRAFFVGEKTCLGDESTDKYTESRSRFPRSIVRISVLSVFARSLKRWPLK